jgi:predicted dinucleotide-binding enzyme
VTPNIRIAVIGPGDAGSLLARDLTTAGADVIGFDLSPLPESSTPVAETIGEAVAGADIVLSLNSSSAHRFSPRAPSMPTSTRLPRPSSANWPRSLPRTRLLMWP